MLNDANFKPVYASGENEPAEFFIEALVNSNSFDLGLGYFSSSGFRALSIGFAYFIKHGGKMRIIINDVLSELDKKAILKGQEKVIDSTFEEKILNDILKLKETLSKSDKHFFNCISWLISTDRIEIKATVPKNNRIGIVHQKFGIFKDLIGNELVFTGSINFSANAIFNNIESLVCDYSWADNQVSKDRIQHFNNLFYKSWNGLSEVVKIIPIENIKSIIQKEFPVNDIESLVKGELELMRELEGDYRISESFKKRVLPRI